MASLRNLTANEIGQKASDRGLPVGFGAVVHRSPAYERISWENAGYQIGTPSEPWEDSKITAGIGGKENRLSTLTSIPGSYRRKQLLQLYYRYCEKAIGSYGGSD